MAIDGERLARISHETPPKLRVFHDPFAGVHVTEARNDSRTGNPTLLTLTSNAGQRGFLSLEGDNLIAVMPSAVWPDASGTMRPVRFSKLVIPRSGAPTLDHSQIIEDSHGTGLLDMPLAVPEYEAAIGKAMYAQTQQIRIEDFGQREILDLYAAFDEAMAAGGIPAEYVPAFAEILDANRASLAEYLFPQENTAVTPSGFSIDANSSHMALNLRHPLDATNVVAVSATIARNFLLDDAQSVTFSFIPPDGAFINPDGTTNIDITVSEAGIITSSFGGDRGEMVEIGPHDGWIRDIVARLIPITSHQLERLRPEAGQATISALESVRAKYASALARSTVEDETLLPKGWTSERILVEAMQGIATKATFVVIGEDDNQQSTVTLTPFDDTHGGLHVIITEVGSDTGTSLRIAKDGTIQIWDIAKQKFRRPSPAQLMALARFMTEGLIPALETKRADEIQRNVAMLTALDLKFNVEDYDHASDEEDDEVEARALEEDDDDEPAELVEAVAKLEDVETINFVTGAVLDALDETEFLATGPNTIGLEAQLLSTHTIVMRPADESRSTGHQRPLTALTLEEATPQGEDPYVNFTIEREGQDTVTVRALATGELYFVTPDTEELLLIPSVVLEVTRGDQVIRKTTPQILMAELQEVLQRRLEYYRSSAYVNEPVEPEEADDETYNAYVDRDELSLAAGNMWQIMQDFKDNTTGWTPQLQIPA